MGRPPEAVEALLRDLGPQLRRGGLPEQETARLPTGLAAVDRLLGGGFPRGRLSELAGTASSGRTALALALLAEATRAGEVCAVIDAADGFDPRAAENAGVVLERVLWARAPAPREALLATQRVLEAGGFGAVLLDLTREARPGEVPPVDTGRPKSWQRLARSCAGGSTTVVLLSLARRAGSHAAVALEMQPARAHFTGTPPLLEAVDAEAQLVRHRGAPTGSRVRVRLRVRAS